MNSALPTTPPAVAAALLLLFSLFSSPAAAQFRSPSERLDDLEKNQKKLEKDVKDLKKDAKKKEDEDILAQGLELGGGTRLTLGGKLEILFIDSQSASFAPLGSDGFTDEPDPHLELQRFRLTPRIELNRWISVRGQLDFRPTDGDTIVKEMVARHDAEPAWWFDSRFQVGLDDRFIRPARRSKNYPLIGTAFWRDESLAFTYRARFGDPDGRPRPETDEDAAGAKNRKSDGGAGTEGFEVEDRAPQIPTEDWSQAFNFVENWGEFALYLSLGQGYTLNDKEVGFDNARFNGLVQDDRELESDLSLREVGVGVGWRRNFQQFGELEALGFYYNDELRDDSISFLQGTDMTEFNAMFPSVVDAGYGTSRNDTSYRCGFSVDYFYSAENLYDTRRNDGLRLFFQWIEARDGRLERDGWYVQGSWRVSFGRLLAERYFRSIEPLVRYGMLDVDVPFGASPRLPGTWDRRKLLVGAIIEVTGDIFIKAEYAFQEEDTGVEAVDNDELLIELLLRF